MQTLDWLFLIHPVLAVVLIYPLLGVVVRLGLQTRHRRIDKAKLPPSIGLEHNQLGQWLAAGVVTLVLIALAVVISTKPTTDSSRQLPLLLAWLGTAASLVALWRVQSAGLRLSFALITWSGLLALGAQPEVFRLSDNPFEAAFWQSHYWGGVLVSGLMLFNLAAWPEIQRHLSWRRLHISANVLAAVLFLSQGISGSRDLLEIPLSWQKPYIWSCDFTAKVCPTPNADQN
tara:strand:+ start:280 stop:972 length:693 start_codon:yes stop_codon:yes gene_type:complete